ncbi:hypothetical protein CNYM01_12903 [Colletotrichum nymphaeae SA-01]|uniref:Heterokaryon incompatibility domain-containing protein n=1 Tax=Colletotrichum nymphaeae SA-01 TaxID=1460502 RepID=A0A135UST3_9PEZI|nr:hypothetical protein CNYM01_12903 [Colletotrichum nymphaeae SA-01]
MDRQTCNIRVILSSPDRVDLAAAFFDQIHKSYSSASLSVTYSTGRVGEHNVVVVAPNESPASKTRNIQEILDDLLKRFPSVRACFLASVDAVASQRGRCVVGDVVVGIRPNRRNGVIHFDAKISTLQRRLVATREMKHVPGVVVAAVEELLDLKKQDYRQQDSVNSSIRPQFKSFRGVIASSSTRLADEGLVDRIKTENGVLCFETAAAHFRNESLVVVAGIARQTGSSQILPSGGVCENVLAYLNSLILRVHTDKIAQEPTLLSLHEFKHFDLERPGFRLLRLERGSRNTPVHCRLIQAYLPQQEKETASERTTHANQDIIPYDALSYCWGDSTRLCQPIHVDGKILFVTEKLLEALNYLRRDYEDRILWVDAICIDQSNVQERGHQVGWMGNLYAHADRVLCWLGHVQHNVVHLFSLLDTFRRRVPQGAWTGWPLDDERWSQLWISTQSEYKLPGCDSSTLIAHLMANEWFRRVWILQEVRNAYKASIGCTAGWIDAKVFAISVSLIDIKLDNQIEALMSFLPGPTRKFSHWVQEPNICTLLWKFRESQASDPRDRFYALLGLASDMKIKGREIVADYTKTEESLVEEVVTYIFGDPVRRHSCTPTKMAQLQKMIPKLSAIAVEKIVFTGAGPAEVETLVQRQNSTVWLSRATINHAWCTQLGLLDYFRFSPVFREVPDGHDTAAWPDWGTGEKTQPVDEYLEHFMQESSIHHIISWDDIKILIENEVDIVRLASRPIRQSRHIGITEKLIDHAAHQGPESFELLLSSRGAEVRITENAAQTLRYCGADVVQMVLRHPKVEIAEAVTIEAVRQGLETTRALLYKRGNEIQITARLIKEAAIYSRSSNEMAKLLLSEKANVIVTSELLAAVVQWFGERVMESVIKEKGLRIEVTSQVLRAIRWMSGDLGMIQGVLGMTVPATEDLVNLLAWAYDVEFMRILFDRQGVPVTVTHETVRCAAHNRTCIGGRMLQLLLNQQPWEYRITEEVITAAARNPAFGEKMVRLLLEQRWREVVVTERVIEAAKSNSNEFQSEAIIELLYSKQKQDRGML